MVRALIVATLLLVVPRAISGQALVVLHIRVALIDAEQNTMPVPRHALLISDNPATASPRRVVTDSDGTADVRLRPGNYTVESDQPVAFGGKAYQWTETLDVAPGGQAVLELTVGNAEIVPLSSAPTTTATPLAADPSFLLPQWQDSVVGLWTPTARASGFVVDARGLIVTNQRAVGAATAVEVQLTPAVKVAATVLAADAVRDVAVLWIDPEVTAAVRPVGLGCPQAATSPVVNGQEIYALGAPLRERKELMSGTVSRVDAHAIASDLALGPGSAGGPVFAPDGTLVGITSVVDDGDERQRGDLRVVPIGDACEALLSAEKKMQGAAPPGGTHLPVEPSRPFPVDAIDDAAKRRAGSQSPYQMSSSDFDVAFITPVLTYGAQHPPAPASGRQAGGRTLESEARLRPLIDFGNWSEYVADFPPVLLVRVTPKMVESFWTTVARGAARTQGISLPPIKHFKSGFSRLRAYCGDAEVTPIHPFKVAQRVSESEAIYEGLYVFDPGALGPQCGTVKLVLYPEKEPERGDTRVVDAKVLEQIWQDFAPYRAP